MGNPRGRGASDAKHPHRLGGNAIGEDLPAADSPDANRYFGGQTVIRQGFAQVQIQGVDSTRWGRRHAGAQSALFLGVFDAPADGSAFVRTVRFMIP